MKRMQRFAAAAAAGLMASAAANAQDADRTASTPSEARIVAHGELQNEHGQYRASKLIGARVQDSQAEDLGEIEDLLISADGTVVAAIVSVGGVLDVGDRLVAVPYEQLSVTTNGKLFFRTTRSDVAAIPTFGGTADQAKSERLVPAAVEQPDARARAEAQAEARESFAEDDPRVSKGIADNKEAFDEE